MIVKVLAAGYCLCLGVALFAESALADDSFDEHWKKLRQAQPPGLTLALKLPQSTFAQGEVISATLSFANASTNVYRVWTGNYDRSGRIPDIAFQAESETGQPVADPLAEYYTSFSGMGGGLGGDQELGVWSITLPANQWLRFDAPGTYRVYAQSSRVKVDSPDAAQSNPGIVLASDIVTIRITPLGAEREQQILADANAVLSQGDDKAKRALETLRYLQTPAARRALLPRLSKEHSMEAAFGLIGAPDPKAEAPLVLQAAKQPDFAVTPDAIWLYGVLRTLGNPRSNDPKPDFAQLQKAAAQARSDIVAAVSSALALKQGDALLTTLLTLLSETPRDANLRARLLANQQDLPRPQLAQIISLWHKLGGDDFLPIIRTAARPPRADPAALGLLAKVAPDEARPLILEDLARAKPLYINPGEWRFAVKAIEAAIPDSELPQLDEAWRRKLRDKAPDLFVVMPLIARYATTNLLADVVAVYKGAEGRWACDIQNSALRYWIRCDPKEGVPALAAALKARQQTGCYHSVLSEVLLQQWVDEALPVVLAALQDEDTEVVGSAVRVLELNASTDVIPQVIAAIQRTSRMAGAERQRAWRADSMAMILLESKRWKLTRSQLEQLAESLPDGQARGTIRRQLK